MKKYPKMPAQETDDSAIRMWAFEQVFKLKGAQSREDIQTQAAELVNWVKNG